MASKAKLISTETNQLPGKKQIGPSTSYSYVKMMTQKNLSCPALSKRNDVGIGYKTLAEDLICFHEADSLPTTLQITIRCKPIKMYCILPIVFTLSFDV